MGVRATERLVAVARVRLVVAGVMLVVVARDYLRGISSYSYNCSLDTGVGAGCSNGRLWY